MWLWIIGGIVLLVLMGLLVFKLILEDIFNFVIETNDDVVDFKETLEKNNAP